MSILLNVTDPVHHVRRIQVFLIASNPTLTLLCSSIDITFVVVSRSFDDIIVGFGLGKNGNFPKRIDSKDVDIIQD